MLDIDTFKANLKGGKYKNAGGARKALGKAQQISATDKTSLAVAINKHFGESETAAKGSTKPAKAAKKAAVKTSAKKVGRPAKAAKASVVEQGTLLSTLDDAREIATGGYSPTARLASTLIERTSQAMTAITAASALAKIETAPMMEEMNAILLHAVMTLDGELRILENKHKAKPPTSKANGKADPAATKAAADFAETAPPS